MNSSLFKSNELLNQICNAFGCLNKATVKIVLPVGSKSFTIFVCENCKPKFEN
jgi:hypothetical protein